jgi:hypothetical protein
VFGLGAYFWIGTLALVCPHSQHTRQLWEYGLTTSFRTLSMTFGRPSIIPDKYMKLDLPVSNIQIVGHTPQSEPTPQMDAMCFTATM